MRCTSDDGASRLWSGRAFPCCSPWHCSCPAVQALVCCRRRTRSPRRRLSPRPPRRTPRQFGSPDKLQPRQTGCQMGHSTLLNALRAHVRRPGIGHRQQQLDKPHRKRPPRLTGCPERKPATAGRSLGRQMPLFLNVPRASASDDRIPTNFICELCYPQPHLRQTGTPPRQPTHRSATKPASNPNRPPPQRTPANHPTLLA